MSRRSEIAPSVIIRPTRDGVILLSVLPDEPTLIYLVDQPDKITKHPPMFRRYFRTRGHH